MYGIIEDAPDEEELKEVLTRLFQEKLRESFKNGIEISMKRGKRKNQEE